jgi:hypothetical protein
MTTAKINKAIKKYKLEIVHERGSGYSYFLDLTTGYQIGDSVYICYLNQQTLDQWIGHAYMARIEQDLRNYNRLLFLENRNDIHPVCKY